MKRSSISLGYLIKEIAKIFSVFSQRKRNILVVDLGNAKLHKTLARCTGVPVAISFSHSGS